MRWALLLSICKDKDEAIALTRGKLVNKYLEPDPEPTEKRTALEWLDSETVSRVLAQVHSPFLVPLGPGPVLAWKEAWPLCSFSLFIHILMYSLLLFLWQPLAVRQDTEVQVWAQ